MICCKIGCQATKEDIVATQEIAYRNESGNIIRTRIAWCAEHEPTCILGDFTNVDLLRHGGGY